MKKKLTIDDIKTIDDPPKVMYVFSDKIKDPNHPLHAIVQTWVDAGVAVYSSKLDSDTINWIKQK